MSRRSFRTLAAALAFPAFVLLTTVLVAAAPAWVTPALVTPARAMPAVAVPVVAMPVVAMPVVAMPVVAMEEPSLASPELSPRPGSPPPEHGAAPLSGRPPVDPDAPPEAVESARVAARGLMQGLLGELSAALSEGGPPQAVEVCSERAPALAATHSGEEVVVGRTSERLRNPDNAPDAFEAAWLDRLEALHRSGELPQEVARVVETEEGEVLRYLKPIIVQADLCLQCHGPRETLSPEVRRVLDERYPEDRATGYRKGDFRGVVTVRVPLF